MKTTFDYGNTAIFMARVATQEYIEDQAEQGKLSEVAKDEHRAAVWLANSSLLPFIASGRVKLAMIERWIAEAVAAHSRPKAHNVLSGELIYRRWCEIRGHAELAWDDPALPVMVREGYEALAAVLMDELHLCCICGEHPKASQLVEVDKMMVCPECAPWLKKTLEGQEE